MSIIITNNSYVQDKFSSTREMIFRDDLNYIEILELTRDYIHNGHKLLTHPLSGSIKPNETPYKTLMISAEKGKLDLFSLHIIEEAIMTAKKFQKMKKTPDWTERVLDDFRAVDFSLIEHTIEKLGH